MKELNAWAIRWTPYLNWFRELLLYLKKGRTSFWLHQRERERDAEDAYQSGIQSTQAVSVATSKLRLSNEAFLREVLKGHD